MENRIGRGFLSLFILFNFEGLFCLQQYVARVEKPRPFEDGGVAQLGEHLFCTQGVRSSILLISTKDGRIAQVVRAHA